MLVRSWNVFHGNAYPPERRAFLEEMVRLACADRPDVLCLQELPVWSLRSLERWSGMQAIGDVAARPILPPWLARAVTGIHHGVLRSAVTGQANAMLLAGDLRVVDHATALLSAKEHRICQAVRLETGLVIGNLHASGTRLGVIEDEVERAVGLVDSMGDELAVLAGDFNLRPELPGFSPPGPGIDHVLARGVRARPLEVWPPERRTLGRRVVLSDHAPVELRLEV